MLGHEEAAGSATARRLPPLDVQGREREYPGSDSEHVLALAGQHDVGAGPGRRSLAGDDNALGGRHVHDGALDLQVDRD